MLGMSNGPAARGFEHPTRVTLKRMSAERIAVDFIVEGI
jgi:hypothetical protein